MVLRDRVFEPIRFPDKFAGIHIDGNQRFGLIDHDVSAGLQPDFRPQRLVDFRIQSVLLEYRRVLQMQLHAIDQCRLELVDEVENRRKLLLVVDSDGREILRQLIAKHALHQIQIAMDQCRRGFLFGLRADVRPEISEKPNVLNEFALRRGLPRRCER